MKQFKLFTTASVYTLTFIACLTACTYRKTDPVVPTCDVSFPSTFSQKVAPVIQTNCAGCHNNANRSGNISLEGYDNIKLAAASGKLLGTINHAPGFAPMPQGGNKLDPCIILNIKRWIDDGSLNN
ncbi:hypothetical protein [Lacibacter sp.]|uniref:hypothetical protein n=1 Tax=Lacibacter sp. TaxID=1915409 RepID=UPI002B4B69BF|nr:hypothetical protein [Lacibacter sp.]HLP39481.1 hypothetical protein [Lacibacter sp.]